MITDFLKLGSLFFAGDNMKIVLDTEFEGFKHFEKDELARVIKNDILPHLTNSLAIIAGDAKDGKSKGFYQNMFNSFANADVKIEE